MQSTLKDSTDAIFFFYSSVIVKSAKDAIFVSLSMCHEK